MRRAGGGGKLRRWWEIGGGEKVRSGGDWRLARRRRLGSAAGNRETSRLSPGLSRGLSPGSPGIGFVCGFTRNRETSRLSWKCPQAIDSTDARKWHFHARGCRSTRHGLNCP